MLEELLTLLEEGKIWSITQLAETLQTTPEMIKAALLHLRQMGKLEESEMEMRCMHQCKGCMGSCQNSQGEVMIWQPKK